MPRRGHIGLLAAALVLSAATGAWAHAFFERAEPRVGSVVTVPPELVVVWFDGRIEPLFSTIAVYDAAERRVDRADGRVDVQDPTRLEVGLPRLPDGAYAVAWKNVALDGHPNEGRFTFTIRAPAKKASP